MQRNLRLVLLPLVLMLLGLGSLFLLLGLMESLDTYRPARAAVAGVSEAAEQAAVTPGLSPSVVLVVVDGLREDASGDMPYLTGLRQMGAYGTARSGQPSYSMPSYAVLSSGAWQEKTGIVLNDGKGPLTVDTVFRLARRHGMSVVMVAHQWWEELNGREAFSSVLTYSDSDASLAVDAWVRDRAVAVLRPDPPDLTLVHFMQVDSEGHAAGAASAQYRDAVLATDSYIKDVVAAMDLTCQTLIVTADHGHLSHNAGGGSGHGGWESELVTVPLVMVGAGVKVGSLPSVVQQTDVAPTVAALLGLPVPGGAQGRVIWEGLASGTEYRATIEAADQARQASVAAADQAHSARLRADRTTRALLVTLIAALVAAGLFAFRRRIDPTAAKLVAASALVYLPVYWLVYGVLFRYAFSLAVFPDASLLTFVRIIGVPALISLLVLYVALARSRAFEGRGGPTLAVEAVTAGAMLSLAVVASAGYIVNGARVTWHLPDFRIGFLQMSALLQFGLIGLLAWAPPVAVAAGFVASERRCYSRNRQVL